MSEPSEDEFVNEGLSEEEIAAAAEIAKEPVDEPEVETASEDQPKQDEQQPPKKDDEPGTVDIRALQEARRENRDLRDRYTRLEERTNIILQQLGQPKQEEQAEQAPDPNEDIFAYAKWQAKQLENVQKQLSERSQHDQQAREQQELDAAIRAEWNNSRATYQRENPDFEPAANHLLQLRVGQLSALGYDPATINRVIDDEIKGVVVQAKQIGASPAELIYNYAKASGYQKAEEKPKPDTVEQIAEKQERHRSLSDAAGGEPPKQLDAKTLANMSDAQFKKLMDNPKTRAQVDRIMGLA